MTFSDFSNPINAAKRVRLAPYPISRFFIGMGFPGFNLPANNRSGWKTAEAALAASLRCESRSANPNAHCTIDLHGRVIR